MGYALEGVRLSSSTKLHFHANAADALAGPDGTELSVQPGDRVTVTSVCSPPRNIQSSSARYTNLMREQSPGTDEVNPSRGREAYVHIAALPNNTLSREISEAALTASFRALFKRRNVRRAPGPQGELKSVVGVSGVEGSVEYLREDWGSKTEFPVTLKVTWDD